MDSYSNSARTKLDQLLHELAVKAKEKNATIEEDENFKGSPNDSDAMPPPTTPSKRSGRAPRKRKKKELTSDDLADANRHLNYIYVSKWGNRISSLERTPDDKERYVLKLFDRSVDMAQFHKNTSMYAMSRSWALNNPSATYEIATCDDERPQHDELDSLQSIASLTNSKPENLKSTCLQTKPNQNTSCLDNMIDAVRDIEILKADNLGRWRKVRENWRQASFAIQETHSSSLLELKSLFTQP